MADESKKEPEDIESILSDLDAILTNMGGDAPAAASANPPKIEVPHPPPPAPIEAPKDPPKANQIELASRDGVIKPPEKKPEPAKLPAQKPIELFSGPQVPSEPRKAESEPMKSAETPKAKPAPAEPPKPAPAPIEPPKPAPAPIEPPKPTPAPIEPPKPAPAPVAAAKIEELPPDTPKEQIRRVAYIYTPTCCEVKTSFSAFLSQAARTISKKPLFLREVLSLEVTSASDPNAVLQKSLQVKATAILAVVEDWPSAKVDELSEACARSNMLFRAVAPGDAQKKSTAVDIIVDMMLLSGEA